MTSANLPAESDADKQLMGGYAGPVERRIVSLAAVEANESRSQFIVLASVERAVAVLREKNPSALDGTPYAVAQAS